VFKHYVLKTRVRVEVKLHECLTSTLEAEEWSASASGNFIPEDKAPGTN